MSLLLSGVVGHGSLHLSRVNIESVLLGAAWPAEATFHCSSNWWTSSFAGLTQTNGLMYMVCQRIYRGILLLGQALRGGELACY
jgi:hypothetical protein